MLLQREITEDTAYSIQITPEFRVKFEDQNRGNLEAFVGPEVGLRETPEGQMAGNQPSRKKLGAHVLRRRHHIPQCCHSSTQHCHLHGWRLPYLSVS